MGTIRMLKNPASFVLGTRETSNVKSETGPFGAAAGLAERRVLARRGWAGENSGHFEHPEAIWLSTGRIAVALL
jgi:hypothetical protein